MALDDPMNGRPTVSNGDKRSDTPDGQADRGDRRHTAGIAASKPLSNRGNGGHFLPGNQVAVGRANPNASKIATWRRAFTRAVTAAEVTLAMRKLIEAVGNGEPWAIKELLDRTLGKADQRLEVTGDGGGPVATEVTLKLQFADRSLLTDEPASSTGQPLLPESLNGEL